MKRMKKSIENMRDCVKQAFEKGSHRGYEFNKMRRAIIVELKNLGFTSSEVKDKLLEWNKHCEKFLSPGEQKRQLLDYVDWFDKHPGWHGCQGVLKDFCIGQDRCSFYKKKTYINKKQVEHPPFDFNEARSFLEKRYRGDGYVLSLVLSSIRRVQVEKATGETVFIGYRAIANLIRDHDGHTIDPMTVYRRVQDLISEGMLEIVVKGKRGNYGQPANGYRFLKWEAPQERTITTHINSNV